MTIWDAAKNIGSPMAKLLAALEHSAADVQADVDEFEDSSDDHELDDEVLRTQLPSVDAISKAVEESWQEVIADAQAHCVSWSVEYVSRIHRNLAERAGADGPGEFIDETASTCWTAVATELFLDDEFDESFLADAVVLSELFYGGHVRSLGLSLGWLILNGFHLQHGKWPIFPLEPDHRRLLEYLSFAGPDTYAPESLRALLGEFAEQQESSQHALHGDEG